LASFQTAFLEVMKTPSDKLNAMVHPYPHLVEGHAC
jgi:hypothetical protein